MRSLMLVAGLCVLSLASGTASGGSLSVVSVDLPGLIGSYDDPDSQKQAEFDLGLSFEAIQRISVTILFDEAVASFTGGYITVGGTTLDVRVRDGDASIRNTFDAYENGQVWMREFVPTKASVNLPLRGWVTEVEDPVPLEPVVLPGFLLSGKGVVEARLVGFMIPPDENNGWSVIGFGPAVVGRATLTIEGQVVPEPSPATLLMLWISAALLLRRAPSRAGAACGNRSRRNSSSNGCL
jgi:hypothetical protein